MNCNKKISVIVLIYNEIAYVDKCIQSICNQTYKNVEIILVDDGSTDGSSEICDRYAMLDERIIVLHKENGGITSARKAGLNVASGEYIGFVDGDDWIEDNMYEEMLRVADTYDVDMVMSDMFRHKFTGEVTTWSGAFLNEGKHDLNAERELIANNLIPGIWSDRKGVNGGVHVKLFRASVLKKYLLSVDESITGFADDKIIVYPILLFENSVYVMHKAFYHGIDRADSASHRYNPTFLLQVYYVYDYLRNLFKESEYENVLMHQLYAFVVKSVMDFANSECERMTPTFFINNMNQYMGKRIVLYGAGKVGCDFYLQLQKAGIPVVMWVDKFPREERVQSVDSIQTLLEYDVILVAVRERELAMQIKNQLVQSGIDELKVEWNQPLSMFDYFAHV